MDGERFDRLTRFLAVGTTRRRLLGGAAAAVGAVGAALGRGQAGAAANDKTCKIGCSGFNRQAKTACQKACKACGGDFNQVCSEEGPFGPTSFICCPQGTFCVQGAGICCDEGSQPCFGPDGAFCCPPGSFCDFETGTCASLATCPSGEPAENCLAGVSTSCDPDGFCALVDDADSGECQCVERVCTGIPCATDADCAESGGVCVTIPGCCPELTFCGVPCGSLGAGARSAGWS